MFTIYGERTLPVRSNLEDLYRIAGISPAKRVNPVAESDQEARKGHPNQTTGALTTYRNMTTKQEEVAIHHAYRIMNRPVWTIPDTTSVIECYRLFIDKKIRQLPVIDSRGTPIGLITREALLGVVLIENGQISHTEQSSIESLISRPLIAADPMTDIRRVAQLMYECDLNCIPVINDADTVIGVITRTDIVKAVSRSPAVTLWA